MGTTGDYLLASISLLTRWSLSTWVKLSDPLYLMCGKNGTKNKALDLRTSFVLMRIMLLTQQKLATWPDLSTIAVIPIVMLKLLQSMGRRKSPFIRSNQLLM